MLKFIAQGVSENIFPFDGLLSKSSQLFFHVEELTHLSEICFFFQNKKIFHKNTCGRIEERIDFSKYHEMEQMTNIDKILTQNGLHLDFYTSKETAGWKTTEDLYVEKTLFQV